MLCEKQKHYPNAAYRVGRLSPIVYGCLTQARAALFELLAAVLTPPQLSSFPELSGAPVFRRQWPSLMVFDNQTR